MADSSAEYHEPVELLSEETMELHRAVVSLLEELEAIDWYQQRIDAAQDEELKEILAHNRDEEKEHAAMSLQRLRRRDPALDAVLREHLWSEGPIAEHGDDGGGDASTDGSLGIGSLRGEDS